MLPKIFAGQLFFKQYSTWLYTISRCTGVYWGSTQDKSYSGGTAVEVYATATLLSTLTSQQWQYATSVTSVVVTVLWQWCTHLCCERSGLDSIVTVMAATVCQQCKPTTVQQRWQWQYCNITVHTRVTLVTTDSGGTDSVVKISVIAMCTSLWN